MIVLFELAKNVCIPFLLLPAHYSNLKREKKMSESSGKSVRSHCYMDYTGDLRKGYFYNFDVCVGDSAILVEGRDIEEEVIVSPRNPPFDELYQQCGEDYLWVESIWLKMEDIKGCTQDPKHITQQTVISATYAVKENGRLADLIEDADGGSASFFISRDFAEKIKKSGLTGWHLTPADYVAPENYGDHFAPEDYDPDMGIAKDREYELYVLNFTGKPFNRGTQIRDVPNACPFCGWGPVVCPECGHFPIDCERCKKQLTFHGKKKKYRGLKIDGLLCASDDTNFIGHVLEADRYDGSDFIYPNIISKRAVNWLIKQKVAPFYACPVYLDVSKASGEQLTMINKAGCID